MEKNRWNKLEKGGNKWHIPCCNWTIVSRVIILWSKVNICHTWYNIKAKHRYFIKGYYSTLNFNFFLNLKSIYFRSGYLTDVNWLNSSDFYLTFLNRYQTRNTLLLCSAISLQCKKVRNPLLNAILKLSYPIDSWLIKTVTMKIFGVSISHSCRLPHLPLPIFLFPFLQIRFW